MYINLICTLSHYTLNPSLLTPPLFTPIPTHTPLFALLKYTHLFTPTLTHPSLLTPTHTPLLTPTHTSLINPYTHPLINPYSHTTQREPQDPRVQDH